MSQLESWTMIGLVCEAAQESNIPLEQAMKFMIRLNQKTSEALKQREAPTQVVGPKTPQ